MDLFIKGARLPESGLVDIVITGGRIAAIAPHLEPRPGVAVLDAGGLVALPGLVNGHTHAAMTLLRGFGDDMPLMEWLQTRIWPVEARMTPEDVYWGTRLACIEMIRSGTVLFQDMYWHYHAVAQAVEDSGMRAGVGAILIDVAGREQGEKFSALAEQLWEETRRYSERVQYVLAPHAIYTVSGELLKWVAEFSARHAVLVHIHLSETRHEVDECLRLHGVRPAIYLDRLGLLNPRVFLAHGVFLDDVELRLISDRGATVVTNPVSNLKLAVGGVFPYSRAAQRGVAVGLGTDGAASNNSLDLFQDLKTFALIQKHAEGDPSVVPAATAWQVATGGQAPVFGYTGELAAGAVGDLILLRADESGMVPEHHLTSNLVYAATGHQVDSVVIAGRVVMKHREIQGEEEVRREAVARALRLCHQ